MEETPVKRTPVQRAANAREEALKADLEAASRARAVESTQHMERIDALEEALREGHDLLLDLRNAEGLGFTTNSRIDSYLAATGHLIGRG